MKWFIILTSFILCARAVEEDSYMDYMSRRAHPWPLLNRREFGNLGRYYYDVIEKDDPFPLEQERELDVKETSAERLGMDGDDEKREMSLAELERKDNEIHEQDLAASRSLNGKPLRIASMFGERRRELSDEKRELSLAELERKDNEIHEQDLAASRSLNGKPLRISSMFGERRRELNDEKRELSLAELERKDNEIHEQDLVASRSLNGKPLRIPSMFGEQRRELNDEKRELSLAELEGNEKETDQQDLAASRRVEEKRFGEHDYHPFDYHPRGRYLNSN